MGLKNSKKDSKTEIQLQKALYALNNKDFPLFELLLSSLKFATARCSAGVTAAYHRLKATNGSDSHRRGRRYSYTMD
jgi:hypothetical protein